MPSQRRWAPESWAHAPHRAEGERAFRLPRKSPTAFMCRLGPTRCVIHSKDSMLILRENLAIGKIRYKGGRFASHFTTVLV